MSASTLGPQFPAGLGFVVFSAWSVTLASPSLPPGESHLTPESFGDHAAHLHRDTSKTVLRSPLDRTVARPSQAPFSMNGRIPSFRICCRPPGRALMLLIVTSSFVVNLVNVVNFRRSLPSTPQETAPAQVLCF